MVLARAATHASKFQADGIPVESPAPPTRTHLLRTPQPQVSAWSEFHLSLLPPSPPPPPPHAAVCGAIKTTLPAGFRPPARLLSPVLPSSTTAQAAACAIAHLRPAGGRVCFHPRSAPPRVPPPRSRTPGILAHPDTRMSFLFADRVPVS